MRISDKTATVLFNLAKKYFGHDAPVRLFGSRVDDSVRGGDIDIHIVAPNATYRDEISFLADAEGQLDFFFAFLFPFFDHDLPRFQTGNITAMVRQNSLACLASIKDSFVEMDSWSPKSEPKTETKVRKQAKVFFMFVSC